MSRRGVKGKQGLSREALAAARKLLNRAAIDRDALSDLAGSGVVGEFETALAAVCGVQYALSTASGTTALVTALLAVGVRAGDEVIVADYGYGGTVAAVLLIGAVPVFADIAPGALSLDPESAEAAIGTVTKAILATHFAGIPADIDGLLDVAARRGLRLVFDGAQSLGATWRDKPVGAYGDATALSFGRGKIVSAGEGGAIVLNGGETYERAVLMSQHPLRATMAVSDDRLECVGEQAAGMRMHPLAAAIAIGELSHLQSRIASRRRIAEQLLECCNESGLLRLFVAPEPACVAPHVHYAAIRRGCGLAECSAFLAERGVQLQFAARAALHDSAWWPWGRVAFPRVLLCECDKRITETVLLGGDFRSLPRSTPRISSGSPT